MITRQFTARTLLPSSGKSCPELHLGLSQLGRGLGEATPNEIIGWLENAPPPPDDAALTILGGVAAAAIAAVMAHHLTSQRDQANRRSDLRI
jgi:hypothetical protein